MLFFAPIYSYTRRTEMGSVGGVTQFIADVCVISVAAMKMLMTINFSSVTRDLLERNDDDVGRNSLQ